MWEARLASRVGLGKGCPSCAWQQMSVANSLATVKPRAAALWHPTLNGDLSPQQVTHGSGVKRWFCVKGQAVERYPHSFSKKKWA